MGKEKVFEDLKKSGTQRRVGGKDLLNESFHGGTDPAVGGEFVIVIADTSCDGQVSSESKRETTLLTCKSLSRLLSGKGVYQ